MTNINEEPETGLFSIALHYGAVEFGDKQSYREVDYKGYERQYAKIEICRTRLYNPDEILFPVCLNNWTNKKSGRVTHFSVGWKTGDGYRICHCGPIDSEMWVNKGTSVSFSPGNMELIMVRVEDEK